MIKGKEYPVKKENQIWERYFLWPLVIAADWIGSFVNQCPPARKAFQSPYVQRHPWPKKYRKLRDRLRPHTDPKGAPHSDTKIFNHPRR